MARVQISIDDDILQLVDEYAKSGGLSRSALLSTAAVDYINAKKQIPQLTKVMLSMAEIFDQFGQGKITKEEMKQMVDSLPGQMSFGLK